MMVDAFRLVKARHADAAFSGEGAALAGGRWNSRGARVVYTSATRSLAALETLVHIDPHIPFEWVMFRCTIPMRIIEIVEQSALPAEWRSEPPTVRTQRVGDDWLRENRSAALSVPSVIVPEERNFLLNPNHADFRSIVIHKPVVFAFDRRLRSVMRVD